MAVEKAQDLETHLQLEPLHVGHHTVLEGFDGCQALLTINDLLLAGRLLMQPHFLEWQLEQDGLNQLATLWLLPHKAPLVLRLNDERFIPLLHDP